MGFLSELRERFRDRTMEKFCAALQGLGIQAQLATRGRLEERVQRDGSLAGRGSLGLIDISEGPIRWVNLRRESRYRRMDSVVLYYAEYGVPDSKVTLPFNSLEIFTVRVKSRPLLGNVVDLRWEGDDLGMGLRRCLDSDISLKSPLMRHSGLTICAYGQLGCWVISTELGETVLLPSPETWSCYQAIAWHLLAAESPESLMEPSKPKPPEEWPPLYGRRGE